MTYVTILRKCINKVFYIMDCLFVKCRAEVKPVYWLSSPLKVGKSTVLVKSSYPIPKSNPKLGSHAEPDRFVFKLITLSNKTLISKK